MPTMPEATRIASSFRDPSGFVFTRNGRLLRQVNRSYREDYDTLIGSGLGTALVEAQLLIPHTEVDEVPLDPVPAYKVIAPVVVPFVSYPYEWCFSQLKDAALLTLDVQKRAMERGMTLKDASAYNVQFHAGRPVLIDTLSFARYREGAPWVAYKQFCQHFLAPLALMATRDVRLNQLSRIFIDGTPLDLASALLPFATRFRLPLLLHVHLHASSQRRYADKPVNLSGRTMSRMSFLGLIDNMEQAVRGLEWRQGRTEWGDYYGRTNYSSDAFQHKQQLVNGFLDKLRPESVWDLGANEGTFSRIASRRGIATVAFDIDPVAVEKNYRQCRAERERNLLPLLCDLTNPVPGIGWQNRERLAFLDRGPADTVLALALVHHLAISNNLPFDKIASFFADCCASLIIEFIPKNDSQVRKLLATREDVFLDYDQRTFERVFARWFAIDDAVSIRGSERTMYLMRQKDHPA